MAATPWLLPRFPAPVRLCRWTSWSRRVSAVCGAPAGHLARWWCPWRRRRATRATARNSCGRRTAVVGSCQAVGVPSPRCRCQAACPLTPSRSSPHTKASCTTSETLRSRRTSPPQGHHSASDRRHQCRPTAPLVRAGRKPRWSVPRRQLHRWWRSLRTMSWGWRPSPKPWAKRLNRYKRLASMSLRHSSRSRSSSRRARSSLLELLRRPRHRTAWRSSPCRLRCRWSSPDRSCPNKFLSHSKKSKTSSRSFCPRCRRVRCPGRPASSNHHHHPHRSCSSRRLPRPFHPSCQLLLLLLPPARHRHSHQHPPPATVTGRHFLRASSRASCSASPVSSWRASSRSVVVPRAAPHRASSVVAVWMPVSVAGRHRRRAPRCRGLRRSTEGATDRRPCSSPHRPRQHPRCMEDSPPAHPHLHSHSHHPHRQLPMCMQRACRASHRPRPHPRVTSPPPVQPRRCLRQPCTFPWPPRLPRRRHTCTHLPLSRRHPCHRAPCTPSPTPTCI
mmetsp:Transcript_42384/g.105790  ORF Transcript_42384/g.105790 Transcript_42384/m.105790 type:complete len:503 (-) Transcript_42384:228-1736(-)